MATFFLVLVIILFVLAISDLIVGVSNDAVNFLNSAVGSKAASFKTIMVVAGLGVLLGATFSSGMMEVARKGIFHPEYFYFSEIIILFLAVMVTDVILLDTFNSFGMPTSTTVSIVFELLGAAVAVSLVKIISDPNALQLYEYINTSKALAIIAGILLSVVIAFTCGAIIQYISRLLFSFDFEKRMRQFGAIWCGIGITAITYFMLIKGVKGASFMSDDLVQSVKDNTNLILIGSFVGWTVILYIMHRFLKVDILTFLVMVGTFALAMAFAGNDLVNFIGVPLAGFNSYEIYIAEGVSADSLLMDGLAGQVRTPTVLLLMAGLIMVATLFLSKKAKSVLKTSVDLGRQEDGAERFNSFLLSRSIVRNSSALASFINRNLPEKLKNNVSKQFDQSAFTRRQVALGKNAPAFDKVRASVTLVVASILIAIGTNLKLPLSTTYVTFMVFMGASLADGAWGRESAVYRVSGVLSVIGGWFFTAFSAFVMAFIIAMIFNYAGIVGIVLVVMIAGYVMYRTHHSHKNRVKDHEALDEAVSDHVLTKAESINLCSSQLEIFLIEYSKLMGSAFDALAKEDLSGLNNVNKRYKPIRRKVDSLNLNTSLALDRIPDNEIESGHLYILVVEYLHEMSMEVNQVLKNSLDHVDNNHKPLMIEQIDELKVILDMIHERFKNIVKAFRDVDLEYSSKVDQSFVEITRKTRTVRKYQIKRIKNHAVGTRNSVLYFNLLAELRNISLFANRILRVYIDLILSPSENTEFNPDSIRKELDQIRENLANRKK